MVCLPWDSPMHAKAILFLRQASPQEGGRAGGLAHGITAEQPWKANYSPQAIVWGPVIYKEPIFILNLLLPKESYYQS